MVETTFTLPTRARTIGAGLLTLALFAGMPGTVRAQEVATLVLQNGERPSGELVDLNASGFTLRVGGQDRQFSRDQVKAVEFAVGPLGAEAQARVNAGQPVVLLRSGQLVDGQLSDISGTHPLNLTIDTAGGPRQFTSSDVAQIYLGGAPQAVGSSGQATPAPPPAPGSFVVAANQPWTDTGIIVARGERVQFTATGDIILGNNMSSGINGNPAATVPTSRYPVANAPAGSLIARVGNGAPFHIGGNTQPIVMPAKGSLMLGVNDDHFGDNSGAFSVSVARLGR